MLLPKNQGMDTSYVNTQIGPDGKRYPIGHPKLTPPGGHLVVNPADDVPGELPPGVMVNPEVTGAELASVASGLPQAQPAYTGPEDAETDSDEDTGGDSDEDTGDADEASEPGQTPDPVDLGADSGTDNSGGGDGSGAPAEFDVETATAAELVEFADAQDPPIEVHRSKRVDEIRDEVKAALAERASA